jgi:class 3 adenylate cyclase
VNFVSQIEARLKTKLFVGFLGVAILMLVLGFLGLFVVNRMSGQVDRLVTMQQQSGNARDMLYTITAQSHFRTMQLSTGDPVWATKLAAAKSRFTSLLDHTESIAIGDHGTLFDDLREIDGRYAEAGQRVDGLIAAGDTDAALQAHILSEHEISHELEDLINGFIADTADIVVTETDAFASDRRFLTVSLAIFAVVSLIGAVVLGSIISWMVIGPVRKIDLALNSLAGGDFTTRIQVPNRDEFGSLSENLNRASTQLEDLYTKLATVNNELQTRVDEQVALIERTSELRRYLSPQVAEAIVMGSNGIGHARRAELSIVFADIRGFTAMSEHSEPEEMTASLNHYLTRMTNIVFRYEGTLDKYIGDAIMVFFNDPLPQPDHAERAVRMALDMQKELDELRRSMVGQALLNINIGIGISTGFVTVGNSGSPSRMDYTVMGNHVNLASRLSADTGPGEILISERTLALLPPGIAIAEPAGQRNLKGIQRPISCFRISPLPVA